MSLKDFHRPNVEISANEAISLYWEVLKEAARLVIALPPAQVTVERLFSADAHKI